MKLDRNINPDGGGKYALVNMRKLRQTEDGDVLRAYDTLRIAGLIHEGENDGAGEQFFVMKYKDVFTAPALKAYGEAVALVAQRTTDPAQKDSLEEYAQEIFTEHFAAAQRGRRIPD